MRRNEEAGAGTVRFIEKDQGMRHVVEIVRGTSGAFVPGETQATVTGPFAKVDFVGSYISRSLRSLSWV